MKRLILILFLIQSLCYSQSQGPLSGGTFSNVNIAGGVNWSNTGRTVSSNNSYSIANNDLSSNGDYTDYLKVTNFGFSIPSGATIDGIEVEVEYFDNGSSNKASDNRVRIVKGGTIGTTDKSAAGKWPGSDGDTYTTYGTATNLWGETWTDTDINATTFGFAISAKRQGGGGSPCYPAIDHIRITVYYTDALPIELLTFDGSLYSNYNYLSWVTATETNNDYFTLEQSYDCIEWKAITTIKGAGTVHTPTLYSYKDYENTSDISYYRLKQTDYDGQSETFAIICIKKREYSNSNIVKIVNILGQEINENTKGFYIIYYKDGSTFKGYKY